MSHLVLPDRVVRAAFMQQMLDQNSGLGYHYAAIHLFTMYRKRGADPAGAHSAAGGVDEILLASRLNAIAQKEVREEIDLLALAAEERAHYDEVQLEGEHIKIQGDPRLMRRLHRNLLENARRHVVPPTQVRLQQTGDTVILTVGPGPAPPEFEQLITDESLRWFRSRPRARRGFCERCSSTLFWKADGTATTSVCAGTIDGPTDLKFAGHIFSPTPATTTPLAVAITARIRTENWSGRQEPQSPLNAWFSAVC